MLNISWTELQCDAMLAAHFYPMPIMPLALQHCRGPHGDNIFIFINLGVFYFQTQC